LDFQVSKNSAGIGALLLFLAFAANNTFYGALPIIGAILVLWGMKGLAEHYREPGVFNNALYTFIAIIAGLITAPVLISYALYDMLLQLHIITADYFGFLRGIANGSFTTWFSDLANVNWQNIDTSILFRFVGYLFLSALVLFIVALIAAIFMRKALKLLKEETGIALFGTTGTVLLLGAVLTIIIIGVALIWIAAIMLAVAFFSIREPSAQPAAAVPPPPYQTQQA
jgi:uncharacterized membrane protein